MRASRQRLSSLDAVERLRQPEFLHLNRCAESTMAVDRRSLCDARIVSRVLRDLPTARAEIDRWLSLLPALTADMLRGPYGHLCRLYALLSRFGGVHEL